MYFKKASEFYKMLTKYLLYAIIFEIFLFAAFSPSRFFSKNSWTCFIFLITSCLIVLIVSFLFYKKLLLLSEMTNNQEKMVILESLKIPYYIAFVLIVIISSISSHFYDLSLTGTLIYGNLMWVMIIRNSLKEIENKILGKNNEPLMK